MLRRPVGAEYERLQGNGIAREPCERRSTRGGRQLLSAVFKQSASVLAARLATLEVELAEGELRWTDYIATVHALAAIVPSLAPERGGGLLTTAEMAGRLGISPKTLLRRKSEGEIRPVLQRGKLIRWRGDEIAR
jgi:hypothetical protein